MSSYALTRQNLTNFRNRPMQALLVEWHAAYTPICHLQYTSRNNVTYGCRCGNGSSLRKHYLPGEIGTPCAVKGCRRRVTTAAHAIRCSPKGRHGYVLHWRKRHLLIPTCTKCNNVFRHRLHGFVMLVDRLYEWSCMCGCRPAVGDRRLNQTAG